jgi:hypothetical protein
LAWAELLCRPFQAVPQQAHWQALLQAIAQLHAEQAIDLVVIDPLAAFLPCGSESASAIHAFLAPLRRLTELGMAVLLIHHPRKGASPLGQAARGSGVLASFADILVEMYWYDDPDSEDRRRKLYGYSRHRQTPRSLVIELNAEETDYINHGSADDEEFLDNWEVFRSVLETAEDRLTLVQIREQWPDEQAVPHRATVHRWLKRAEARGLVARCGKGSKGDPHRYWLPARHHDLPLPPGASKDEIEAYWRRKNWESVDRVIAENRAREASRAGAQPKPAAGEKG